MTSSPPHLMNENVFPQTVPLLLQPLSPNPLNTSSDGPFCGVSGSSFSSSMESLKTKKIGAIGIDLAPIQREMEEKTRQMEELIGEGRNPRVVSMTINYLQSCWPVEEDGSLRPVTVVTIPKLFVTQAHLLTDDGPES
ncbi:hypothetical protein BLNAU_19533 [Blattamonas nauphoetae]|uniref:Uncharacterized protein n=1 Tax=Blattamonas nauphoetae TaxID=2049346 RepID=A0ABQ9X5E0_9EUKA|nr:hypothetical protein BLNAU_19533 [Blattamonas nauphoetae]